MKSKFFKKKPDPEIEQDEDEESTQEVSSSGPSIASASKSKIAVAAASALLITFVVYFLFFKGDDKNKNEKLEQVQAPAVANFSQSEDGKSVFELPEIEEKKEDVVVEAKKPEVPEVPTLPDLPIDAILPKNDLPDEQKLPENQQQNQNQQNQNQQNVTQNIPTNPQNIPVNNPSPQPTFEEKDPRYAPIIVFSGTAQGTPSRGVGYENNIVNLNKDPIESLEQTKSGVTATYIKDRINTIAQGKLLTAVLETAINTEVPGSVRAIVSRDVYGEAGSEVLIPRGSRLYGSYSSNIVQGQGRVEISWSRLIRPDGVDLAINFNASDQFGRSGISGEVDNRYGSIISNSILTSILAVGGVAVAQKLFSNNNLSTTTTNPTQGTTTITANATNQAITDVSKTITDTVGQIIGNTLDINPVIRVPQGTRVTVIVNSDIKIPSMKRRF